MVFFDTTSVYFEGEGGQTLARLLQLFLGGWRFQRLRGVLWGISGMCGRNVVPLSTGYRYLCA